MTTKFKKKELTDYGFIYPSLLSIFRLLISKSKFVIYKSKVNLDSICLKFNICDSLRIFYG